jgi:hypothetical protein
MEMELLGMRETCFALMYTGLLFVVLGIILLATTLYPSTRNGVDVHPAMFLPLLLIVGGLMIVFHGFIQHDHWRRVDLKYDNYITLRLSGAFKPIPSPKPPSPYNQYWYQPRSNESMTPLGSDG